MTQYNRMTKAQLIHELEMQRDSRERLEAIVDGSRDAVFISNENSHFTLVNAAACELTGYSREELLEMRIPDLHEEVDLHAFRDHHHSIMEGQEALTEAEVLRKDGTKVVTEFNNRRIMVAGTTFMHTVARDITERKRAEEERRELDSRWQSVTESSPDLILVLDPDLNIQSANRASPGLTRKDLIGKPIREFVDESQWPKVKEALGKALLGRSVTYETTYVGPDGEEIRYESRVVSRKSDGQVRDLILSARDITERRRAEEALRESEERYRGIFTHTNNGVAVYEAVGDGEDFVFLDFNPRGEEIDDCRREDLLGKRVTEVFPGVVEFGLLDVFRRVWRTGKPEHHAAKAYRDDRVLGWRENFVHRLGTGEVVAVYADITERKQAEEALSMERSQLTAIIDNVPVLITRFDPENNMLSVNKEFENTFGWKTDEIKDIDLMKEVYPDPDYRAQAMEYMQAATKEWREFRARCRSGRLVHLEWSNFRLDDETQIGIGIDITDRKRLEQAVRASRDRLRGLTADMERVREEERTSLARELHDEVGQAMAALKMDLDLIQGRVPEGQEDLTDLLASMIAIAEDSVDRVNRMASDLRSPILDVLGLKEAVESLVWEYRERRGIDVNLEMGTEELERVWSRDLTVYRILQAALSNARRHAEASRIDVSLRVEGEVLGLEVLDDGIGITDEQMQDHRSFGLIGMQERADRIGGFIRIERRPDGGTRIRASVPIAPDNG